MADSKKYDGSTWEHSLRKLGTDTDTFTTLPANIIADGNSATVGLVGNMSQTGTPTPTNPIQPQECGDRTNNLWNGATIEAGRLDNGVVGYKSDTTNITFSDNILSFTTTANYRGVVSDLMPIDNEMYISYNLSSLMTKKVAWYAADKTFLSQTTYTSSDYRFGMLLSPPENAKFFRISFEPSTAGPYTIAYPKLNTGSTALPFEPYGYKIPILNNSQTTNVYLGEVQSTRQIKQLIFDGTEDWRYDGTNFYLNISSMSEPVVSNSPLICSHFVNSSQGMRNGSNWAFVTLYQSATSANAWKTYLQQQYAAGTPVCVWYVLATPETAVVNEPLRKIGNYADTVSGITIPTIAGANTIDVDTTLKPSEVSVNYHGWHPVQSVHERESGAWD